MSESLKSNLFISYNLLILGTFFYTLDLNCLSFNEKLKKKKKILKFHITVYTPLVVFLYL